jgi:CheY-like chemotaxis protein
VDDDLLLRLDTVTFLNDEGFEAVEAGNADEAVEILKARIDIRIVFTDIQMPGSMDGIRLAHYVRKRWPPIEIIMTSGRTDVRKTDIPERGLFFPKPVAPVALISAMRKFIQDPNG